LKTFGAASMFAYSRGVRAAAAAAVVQQLLIERRFASLLRRRLTKVVLFFSSPCSSGGQGRPSVSSVVAPCSGSDTRRQKRRGSGNDDTGTEVLRSSALRFGGDDEIRHCTSLSLSYYSPRLGSSWSCLFKMDATFCVQSSCPPQTQTHTHTHALKLDAHTLHSGQHVCVVCVSECARDIKE